MFQIKYGELPETITDIFTKITQLHNLRQNRDFSIRSANAVYHGSESISNLNLENSSFKSKRDQFSQQFQKRNQKVDRKI